MEPPPSPVSSRGPSPWPGLLLAVLVLLAASTPGRVLPVRRPGPQHSSVFYTYSKYILLLSLEHQERLSRVPETRIRGSASRAATTSGPDRQLKEGFIRVIEIWSPGIAVDRPFDQNFTLHLPELDSPLERTPPGTAARETLLTDNLMSAIAAVDDTGAYVRTTEYLAYGASRGGADTGLYGFAGARKLGSTGLLYMRNRIYDPTLMRFLSRDPIGFQGGWTLYGYTGGNPIRYRDPSGLTIGLDILLSWMAVEAGVHVYSWATNSPAANDIDNVQLSIVSYPFRKIDNGIDWVLSTRGGQVVFGQGNGDAVKTVTGLYFMEGFGPTPDFPSLGDVGRALRDLHEDETGAIPIGGWLERDWVSPKEWARQAAGEVLKKCKASGSGTGARSGMHGRPYNQAANELDKIAETGRFGDVSGLLDPVRDELRRIAEQWRQRARGINHPFRR